MSAFSGRDVQSRIYRAGVFGRRPVVPVEPARLAAAARRRMSPAAWAYVAGSAGRQQTARANVEAFGRHRLVPRMLVDVESRDTSVELFGRRIPAPLLLAPIGVLEMAHRDADLAAARAARALGLPMVISSQGSVPMEQTAAELGDTPRWFQLYWSKDDDVVDSFVDRAAAIGSDALVVTLDTHVLGWRTKDLDLGYLPFARAEGIAQYTSDPAFRRLVRGAAPRRRARRRTARRPRPSARCCRWPATTPVTCAPTSARRCRAPPSRRSSTCSRGRRSPGTTSPGCASARRCRSCSRGSSTPTTPRLALDHGVDGIVVSNHGGRQVDGAIGSLDALPGVVEVVDGRVPVLFDSGIRGGADVVKALALGAAAVLVGRPWVYGLALAGADGARTVLEHLWAELDLTMALCGVRSIDQIGPDLLAEAP